MKVSLYLSGVAINNDWVELIYEKFSDFNYSYFDSAKVGSGENEITPSDICITAAMNSRVGSKHVKGIMAKKRKIESILSQIPDSIFLQDEIDNNVFKLLSDIFEVFCSVKWVKLSTASKILYKKRPKLIPMVDRNLENHYWPILTKEQRNSPWGKYSLAIIKEFRNDLIKNLDQLKKIKQSLIKKRKEIRKISLVRVLESIIWNLHQSRQGTFKKCLACKKV